MDKVYVSIAMCTYNGTQYIQEQLDSIAAQTRLPDELIICDDISNDNTIDIIKAFADKSQFPIRLYINEKNLKLCKNREKAISLCAGEFILLSDWDDVWKPQKIEKILTTFIENPGAGYVFSDAELVDKNMKSIGYTLWESRKFHSFIEMYKNPDAQVKVLLKQNIVWGTTLALRASIRDLVIPLSPFYYLEDAWIALLASCAGLYGVPISDSLLYYRQHSSQTAGGKNTLNQKFNRAKNPQDVDIFKRQVQGLVDAKERLLLMQNILNKDFSQELNLIQEKAEHFSKRVSIRSSNNFLFKVKDVGSEALTGKYHRFSNSWQSVIKDLWF